MASKDPQTAIVKDESFAAHGSYVSEDDLERDGYLAELRAQQRRKSGRLDNPVQDMHVSHYEWWPLT
ncbi:MAG: hypothetical protein QM803_02690 [Rhodocyclaceae bacterium]